MTDEHPQEQEEANQSPWRTIPASEVAVPSGYVYLDARATEKELELTVRVEKPLEYCTLCEAETGTLSKNGVSKLKFRDIPQGNRCSTLIIVRQRYVCQHDAHHFPSDSLPGIEVQHSWTRRLTRYVRAYPGRTNLDNSRETGLSDKSVAVIHAEHAAEIGQRQRHVGKFEAVGLDEKYVGGKPCFVFVDLVAREYLELLPNNTAETIEASLMLYQHRDLVQIAVMDMTNNYAEIAARVFPNARIIYDFYHVVALASKCRDDVRVAAWRMADTRDKHLFSARKTYWTEFDSCEDWLGEQGFLFGDRYPPVLLAHQHFLLFLDLIRFSNDPADAACRFDYWVAKTPPSLEPYFRKLINAIEQRRDGVFGYFQEGATNGPTEAVNRNIQAEIDKGRRYRIRGLNQRMQCKAEIKRQQARDLLKSGTVAPASASSSDLDLSVEASLKRTARMRAQRKAQLKQLK
jgi:hypothetical protein